MADCGICLDVLQNPVSIPCGHVHCERCLCSHINSGEDALRSTCPTCRTSFHIVTPDFTFVPEKYHDFIWPSVRKIYMDIPSITEMSAKVDDLTGNVEKLAKENKQLLQRCKDLQRTVDTMASEKNFFRGKEEEARAEADDLRAKYGALQQRYQGAQSWDQGSDITLPLTRSRRSTQTLQTGRETYPTEEEHRVSPQASSSRPKRGLPRSRPKNTVHRGDDEVPQVIKRQRTNRASEVGSSSQAPNVSIRFAEAEDEY